MKIAVASDHGGFPLKETVLEAVEACGHIPINLGTDSMESVDYPDFAEKAGKADRRVQLVTGGEGED